LLHVAGRVSSHDAADVQVHVGELLCSLVDDDHNLLSAALAPQLPLRSTDDVICSVPGLPAGVYNITLTTTAGVAQPLSSSSRSDTLPFLFQYEQVARVASFSPSLVSSGGGARMTIRGSGFSLANGDNVVTVGGFRCVETFFSEDRIECRTPDLTEVDFGRLCPARDAGSVRNLAAAGVGTVLVGSRGALLQVWLGIPSVINQLSSVGR
jgi:hypothetical protein